MKPVSFAMKHVASHHMHMNSFSYLYKHLGSQLHYSQELQHLSQQISALVRIHDE